MTATPKHPLEIPSRTGSNHSCIAHAAYNIHKQHNDSMCNMQTRSPRHHAFMHPHTKIMSQRISNSLHSNDRKCMYDGIYCLSHTNLYRAYRYPSYSMLHACNIEKSWEWAHATLKSWESGPGDEATVLIEMFKCPCRHLPGNYYPESVDSMSSRDACIIICYYSTTYVY